MRALRILIILAVVLGGLFVAADRIAVNFAESEAADKIQNTQGLTGAPDVSIKGFPFLTQVANGSLDEVDADLSGIQASSGGRSLTITKMSAQLHDVAISNNFSSAVANRATGSGSISYADLSKAAEEGVAVSYGGQDKAGTSQVKVTARATVLGRTLERNVVSTVSIVGGDTVKLHAEAVPGSEIPGLEKVIREKIDFERRIEGLPAGLKLDKVEATRDGIEVSVIGSNVELAG
ncbi:LmeA family phospholipid-binding protein [Streptomyces sp. H27-D2]|uniref:LmeA family phospholipid-binding protein n=1 Tax=Streptomyces sp. H27-D2 TaxID=3046304 RepID=UPI002DB9987C|nr:DUF2993 domain-containing protein [Streptomyces sp. H27-D2]MEC4015671.1 DUF2993 domain-containing protein [Streptomyces sp. H27-D2]